MKGGPLLFLGPGGKYSSGRSEVFSLPTQGGNLSLASCTLPDYPIADVYGYAAFVKDGFLQLCGNIFGSRKRFEGERFELTKSMFI